MKKMQKWIALLLAVLMLSAIFCGLRKTDDHPGTGRHPADGDGHTGHGNCQSARPAAAGGL